MICICQIEQIFLVPSSCHDSTKISQNSSHSGRWRKYGLPLHNIRPYIRVFKQLAAGEHELNKSTRNFSSDLWLLMNESMQLMLSLSVIEENKWTTKSVVAGVLLHFTFWKLLSGNVLGFSIECYLLVYSLWLHHHRIEVKKGHTLTF